MLNEVKVREKEYEMIKDIEPDSWFVAGSPTCDKGTAVATSRNIFLVDVDNNSTTNAWDFSTLSSWHNAPR